MNDFSELENNLRSCDQHRRRRFFFSALMQRSKIAAQAPGNGGI
jgi:hypothetical protein